MAFNSSHGRLFFLQKGYKERFPTVGFWSLHFLGFLRRDCVTQSPPMEKLCADTHGLVEIALYINTFFVNVIIMGILNM